MKRVRLVAYGRSKTCNPALVYPVPFVSSPWLVLTATRPEEVSKIFTHGFVFWFVGGNLIFGSDKGVSCHSSAGGGGPAKGGLA